MRTVKCAKVIKEWLLEGKHVSELLREMDENIDNVTPEELLVRGLVARSTPIIKIGVLFIYKCDECEKRVSDVCLKFVEGIDPRKIVEARKELERCEVIAEIPTVKDVSLKDLLGES